MAAVTATQLGDTLPIALAPYHLEFWRIPAASAADTCTITPARGRFVIAATGGGPSSNNLSTAGTDTTVVFTVKTTFTGGADVTLVVQD